MLGFEVEKEKIKEIIYIFSKQYNVADNMTDSIIKMVDEHVYSISSSNVIEILKEENDNMLECNLNQQISIEIVQKNNKSIDKIDSLVPDNQNELYDKFEQQANIKENANYD